MIDPLNAFKIKPFDLEPVYASWPDGPRFVGNLKADTLSVDDWLDRIKAGCVERKVPEECWHRVAQHFMGGDASARLYEVKKVMAKIHDGKYRWNWKKFTVAMRNMGWDIDSSVKETVKVRKKGSKWWILWKKEDEQVLGPTAARKAVKDGSAPAVPPKSEVVVYSAGRTREGGKADRPTPARSRSDGASLSVHEKPLPPPRTDTMDTVAGTTITGISVWLLNVTKALDMLPDRSRVMSTLSGILITLGSIPEHELAKEGVLGGFLASETARTAGVVAKGVGNWMKVPAAQEVNTQKA